MSRYDVKYLVDGDKEKTLIIEAPNDQLANEWWNVSKISGKLIEIKERKL